MWMNPFAFSVSGDTREALALGLVHWLEGLETQLLGVLTTSSWVGQFCLRALEAGALEPNVCLNISWGPLLTPSEEI